MPQTSLTSKRRRLKDMARGAIASAVRPVWGLLPRALYHGRWPLQLCLKITGRCNLNCAFCAYQYANQADKAHMPDDLFEKVLKDIAEARVRRVMLSPNLGEPPLVPRFLHKVRELRKHGVRFVELTTNGSYLHKVGIAELLTDGPDQINISFPGFDKEMYERDVRVRLYEQTRSNVLEILRMNHALGRPKVINLWLRGDLGIERLMAAPEMEEVKKLANEIAVMTEVDDWLGLIRPEQLPSGYVIQQNRPALQPRPCVRLFDLTINPDGDIQLCSCRNIVGDPDLRIGNLRELSILEAHARIPRVFEKWESGVYPACCQGCSMYGDPSLQFAAQFKRVTRNRFFGP